MLRKYCLTILLLLFCIRDSQAASFWDVLDGCLTNPCNCGLGTRYEKWNGQTLDKGPQNLYCPPWNKEGGRYDNTCLANTPYPTIFVPWYLAHCAESTTESTFFSPKIRIRNQSCNLFGCWTLTKTLNWDGECVIWPTGYALPLLRICARVASPANSDTKTPEDLGYTNGKHLNFEGFEEDDDVLIGVDGQLITLEKPKLCAYRDPSILDFLSQGITLDGIDIPDLMDFNPLKQPLHKTKDLSIIAKIILFIIDSLDKLAQGLVQMLNSLFDLILPTVDGISLNIFQPIFDLLSAIIELFADILKIVIEEYGQLNRLVSNYKFGCVELPLGPFPPPYCPTLAPFKPNPTTQSVCPLGTNGIPVTSTLENLCVVSKLKNNFIRNTIRTTFDYFIPLCMNGEDPTKTDKCVTLSNIGLFNSASALHTATARRDTIKPCSSSSSSTPCVNTSIPFSCSVTANGCEDGFRVVYAEKIGETSMPSNYFRDDLPDCGTSTNNIGCQRIWGINIGEFLDVSLLFPNVQSANDISNLTKTFSMKDTSNTTRNFTGLIPRKSYFDTISQLQLEPDQVCVFENNLLVGCETRMKVELPKAYSCNFMSGFSCTSSYFIPKFVALMESGTDYTGAIVAPLSVNGTTASSKINLAGYDFGSFVTDDTFIQKPFSGSHSINPSSIYGTYKNNAAPYNSSGVSTNATYLYGLEYVNDKYIQGGKRVCLIPNSKPRCPLDVTNCVLTNLLNKNIVNCGDFINKGVKYPNLRLCTIADTSCSAIDSLAGINGGNGITINKCGTTVLPTYCYTNNANVSICNISTNPTDRFDPAASLGYSLSANDYYNGVSYTTSGASLATAAANSTTTNPSPLLSTPYDSSLYGLRDKTAVELNLCIAIPQPTCSAITTPSASDGNATWNEASVGTESTGTCLPNLSLNSDLNPLKRYCLSDAQTQTVKFDTLDANVKCVLKPSITLVSETNDIGWTTPKLTGTILVGKVTSDNWDITLPSSFLIYGETFYSTLTFNIVDKANFSVFKLTSLKYKDNVTVTVNGGANLHYTTPTFFSPPSNIYDIDLLPYLVEGINTISITLHVQSLILPNRGYLYYVIDYK